MKLEGENFGFAGSGCSHMMMLAMFPCLLGSREHRMKVRVRLNDNATVSYEQQKIYLFEPTRSVADQDDAELCTVNIMQMVCWFLMMVQGSRPTVVKIPVSLPSLSLSFSESPLSFILSLYDPFSLYIHCLREFLLHILLQ